MVQGKIQRRRSQFRKHHHKRRFSFVAGAEENLNRKEILATAASAPAEKENDSQIDEGALSPIGGATLVQKEIASSVDAKALSPPNVTEEVVVSLVEPQFQKEKKRNSYYFRRRKRRGQNKKRELTKVEAETGVVDVVEAAAEEAAQVIPEEVSPLELDVITEIAVVDNDADADTEDNIAS